MSPEILRDDILQLSKDLIRIPSVTEDQEAIDLILNKVRSELAGFSCEEFVDPESGTKSLLFFNTPERPEKFRVLLNGHLDVVPANANQYSPYESDGKLYGRGAADMKAGAAIELLVFKSLAHNLSYPIAIQFATDEETGGFNSTGYQVKSGVRTDLYLSGESTHLDIENERKGVLVLEVITHGTSGHAAYLQEGDNAVVKMARLISKLADRYPIPDDPQAWITTLNVANIQTPNTAHNKIPDVSTALLDFRHVPQDTKSSLEDSVRQLATSGTEIKIDRQGHALYSDPNHADLTLLASIISEETGSPARFIRAAGSSDSRHFSEVGAAAVDFGPSGFGLHSDEEYGEIESYERYALILSKFLRSIK